MEAIIKIFIFNYLTKETKFKIWTDKKEDDNYTSGEEITIRCIILNAWVGIFGWYIGSSGTIYSHNILTPNLH